MQNDQQMLEHRLIHMIKKEANAIEILKIVRELNLSDCWIAAGFVRNLVWNNLHGFLNNFKGSDIDVIFYDAEIAKKFDSKFDEKMTNKLKKLYPEYDWQVKNQARMHLKNKHSYYKSTEDAISYWPETATVIGVRINGLDEIEVLAPYGLTDLFELILKPTPKTEICIFKDRVKKKGWLAKWPKLKLVF